MLAVDWEDESPEGLAIHVRTPALGSIGQVARPGRLAIAATVRPSQGAGERFIYRFTLSPDAAEMLKPLSDGVVLIDGRVAGLVHSWSSYAMLGGERLDAGSQIEAVRPELLAATRSGAQIHWSAWPRQWHAMRTAEAKADLATQIDNTDQSLEAAREAVLLDERSWRGWQALAAAQSRLGLDAECLASCERVITLMPTSPPAYYMKATTLARHRAQPEAALAAAERGVQLAPRHASMHQGLGYIHWQAGRLDEALAAYHEAVRLKPGDENAAAAIVKIQKERAASAAPDPVRPGR